MTHIQSLPAAGFAATAISYGPARMGFGLFVPQFREAFPMPASVVGVVSGLGFLGMFAGLILAQVLLTRRGPEMPVLLGLFAAALGLSIVAAAPSVHVLALGVFLAASSAGFAWTPFNDAVNRKLPDFDRPAALCEISTGTSIGIAGAGLAALGLVVANLPWRVGWAIFAGAAVVALGINWAALRHVERAEPGPDHDWHRLIQGDAGPLYGIAFVFGVVSSVFISFAADHLRGAGGVPGLAPAAMPALVFVIYGIFGLPAFRTGQLRQRVGLLWLLRGLLLMGGASVACLVVAPGHWGGLILSAGLQGLFVMMISAVLSFWSERLFPALPSLGFTAALLATAAGSVTGPVLAGLILDRVGAQPMFLATALLPVLTAVILRPHYAQERPAGAVVMG